tara:strand:+ start:2654 stop:2923 length:270 start_codon:yes stop_codon:yes gene_type:complete
MNTAADCFVGRRVRRLVLNHDLDSDIGIEINGVVTGFDGKRWDVLFDDFLETEPYNYMALVEMLATEESNTVDVDFWSVLSSGVLERWL